MIVLKFGGSSMADAERILASARIVQATHARTPVTVVVSAMAGVTDALLHVASLALADPSASAARRGARPAKDSAAAGVMAANVTVGAGDAKAANDDWRDELARLEARHRQTFLAIGGWAPDVFALRWRALVAEAEALRASGFDPTSAAGQAAMARFSGWGERLAVDLMAHALTVCGVLAQAFADEPIILVGPRHGDLAGQSGDVHHRLPTQTNALLDKLAIATPGDDGALPQPSILATRAALTPRLALLLMRGGVPVLPGYIARDSAGRVTTLGRNGSDHSAAVIAAALGAAALYLYSDVPGLYTADPRVVPDAALLPALTYAEAGEIAALGARALHPRTVEPTARWGIPLSLRSSLAPDAPGTDILPDAAAFADAAAYALSGPSCDGGALTRPERWVVAARPWEAATRAEDHASTQTNIYGASNLIEVSATRLPPWPACDNDDGCPACVITARKALDDDTNIQPVTVWSTARQLRVVVDAAESEHAQRLLHAALAAAAAGHACGEASITRLAKVV